jgi:glycogen debranching enzyme
VIPKARDVRFLPAPALRIARASDLGSVQVLKHGNRYLLTDAFGDIHADSRGLGLYDGDTRILSLAALRVAGFRPVLLQGSVGSNYRSTIQMTNPSADRNPEVKVHPLDDLVGRTLGISRTRVIGDAGVEERLRLVNHGARRRMVPVTLALGADFADIFEVRGYPRPARGRRLPVAVAGERVTFRYDGLDGIQRSTFIACSEPPTASEAHEDGGPTDGAEATTSGVRGDDARTAVRLRWRVALAPGAEHELCWTLWSEQRPVPEQERDESTRRADLAILFPDPPRVSGGDGALAYELWDEGATRVDSDHELFNLVIHRSAADLRLLRNRGPVRDASYIAAGVPWFTTLFGRDSILAALQTLAFRPRIAVETLEILAAYQATEADPDRDAEPGKILHELRTGEMARAGELPHTPYYGSIDSTPLWLILLGATFDWTGDRALLDRLWPNALAALEWIDRDGDRDGDGFVEYERRSPRGLVNQGWKDSSDAIRDRKGREATPPIALAEVQGYVFDAKRRMARLARARDDHDLARRLDAQADALRDRFEAAFWVKDQRYYAMALDGDKRQADAIGSNAGQCLWSGIIAPERARDVVDRLLDPSMFSGWGIRTYASGQRGYNPIGYHTGTVWPHDTSFIVAGLKRYGFDDAANRLTTQVMEAAQQFPDYRLPELFCGFDRSDSPRPVPYPVACSPQAWAAGASFLTLQTMLGLQAHADRAELELSHPHLPGWLGRVSLSDLRVGDASVDILFHRWRGTTSAEVLHKVGRLDVTIHL